VYKNYISSSVLYDFITVLRPFFMNFQKDHGLIPVKKVNIEFSDANKTLELTINKYS